MRAILDEWKFAVTGSKHKTQYLFMTIVFIVLEVLGLAGFVLGLMSQKITVFFWIAIIAIFLGWVLPVAVHFLVQDE